VWFGPRRWMGWGWTPVSWEGWAVLVVFAGAAVGLVAARLGPLVFVAVAPLLVVSYLKGTSPGGPAAWREFRGRRDNG
jgi:hypothetical protein